MTTLLLAAALAVAPPADTLRYTITFVREPEPALAVELAFRTGPGDRTVLRLPSEWGGQTDLHRALHDLAAAGPGVALEDTDQPHVKRIARSPGARVVVTYRVRQDFDAPLERANYYRPVVRPDWFHAIGTTWIVRPDYDDERPIFVTFAWRGLGPGETVATSFGAGALEQAAATTPRLLRHALYLGGDIRLHEAEVPGGRVAVALRGTWDFDDGELVALVRRVVTAVRGFWDDGHDVEHYLVSAIPNASGLGGTRLHRAFGTFLGPETAPDLRLTRLLVHELMHEWIGGRLRAGTQPDALMYWFTEGFTDFYTGRVLRRAGFIDDAEYAGLVNDAIREYLTSPLAGSPFDETVDRFWTDRDAGRLPYLRGHLFALELDAALRRASGGRASLDDVLRELLARAGAGSLAVDDDVLAAALAPHLGAGPARDAIARQIRGGAGFPLADDLLGSCFMRVLDRVPRFDPGFDVDASTRDRVVTGVDPAGPAHAAGLRDGVPLLGWSIRHGDTSEPVVFVVEEDGGRRRIEYLPVTSERVSVPRFVADPECDAAPTPGGRGAVPYHRAEPRTRSRRSRPRSLARLTSPAGPPGPRRRSPAGPSA